MKQKILAYVRRKLGIPEGRGDVQQQIDFLSNMVNFGVPAVMAPEEDVLTEVLPILNEQFGSLEFKKVIHKNDLMFHAHLFGSQTQQRGLLTYYRTGMKVARSQSEAVKKIGLQPKKLLDFGAGYGRVSRFLPHFFPGSEIHVSDVKRTAVKFQAAEFGFRPVFHSSHPKSFEAEKFDVILALSVFTHLPQNLFNLWFEKLLLHLQPKAVLYFSFNELKSTGDFKFTEGSEETLYMVADRLKNPEEYGSTHVSKLYLQSLAERNGVRMEFLGKDFKGSQDVALVVRE